MHPGDYNLSGERYREETKSLSAFPKTAISTIITTITPPKKIPKTEFGEHGKYPIIDQSQNEIAGWTNDELAIIQPTGPVLIFGDHTCAIKLLNSPFAQGADGIKILKPNPEVQPEYLYYTLRWRPLQSDGYKRHFTKLKEYKIPLPPLEVQKEIVAEIEGYQKVIDGARAVLDHYRPHIPIDPEWPVVDLGDVINGKPKNGYSGKPVTNKGDLKVLTLTATTSGILDPTKYKYLDENINENAECRCKKGDIYLQRGNTKELVGTAALFDLDDSDYIYPDLMIRVRANEDRILTSYLLQTLQSPTAREYLTRSAVGAAGNMPKINQGIVIKTPIPLPPLETQKAIVAEIESEQALVATNRELIERMEVKIQAAIARVWGEDNSEATH